MRGLWASQRQRDRLAQPLVAGIAAKRSCQYCLTSNFGSFSGGARVVPDRHCRRQQPVQLREIAKFPLRDGITRICCLSRNFVGAQPGADVWRMLALRSGMPVSSKQTRAKAETPSRIMSFDGSAKQSRRWDLLVAGLQ